MEYVLGLFPSKEAAARGVDALKALGLGDDDYHMRTHEAATRSVKGWLEWLFDMPEPLSGKEAEGLPHEDAHQFEDRVHAGETLLAARARERSGAEVAGAMRRSGSHSVHRYRKRAEGWTHFTGEDEAKTA